MDTPTRQFPDGHFEFKALVTEQVLLAFLKTFEPEEFQRRQKGKDKFSQWAKR